jgi:hypothetical protein
MSVRVIPVLSDRDLEFKNGFKQRKGVLEFV